MRRNRHMSAANAAPTPICVHESSQKCGNTPSVRLLTIANTALRKYQTEMYHATRRDLPPSPAGASSKDAVGAFKDAALAVVTRVARRTMPNDASPETTLGRKIRVSRTPFAVAAPRRVETAEAVTRVERLETCARAAPSPSERAAPSPTAAIARDALAEKWLFQVNNAERDIFFG